MDELSGQHLSFPGRNIIVRNGVVHLWGYYVWSPEQVRAARVAAESIPGGKSVEDHTGGTPPLEEMKRGLW
ncbi:BON domain-containing protein [Paraburkholderia sp. A3BS-1L]